MADFEKVSLSDDELDVLSNNDFAEIARKGRIDGEISVEELQWVTPDTLARFKEYLKIKERIGIKKETLEGLEGLVVKVGVSVPVVVQDIKKPSSSPVVVTEPEKPKEHDPRENKLQSPSSVINYVRAVELGLIGATPKETLTTWWSAKWNGVLKGTWNAANAANDRIPKIMNWSNYLYTHPWIRPDLEHAISIDKAVAKTLKQNKDMVGPAKEAIEKRLIMLERLEASLARNDHTTFSHLLGEYTTETNRTRLIIDVAVKHDALKEHLSVVDAELKEKVQKTEDKIKEHEGKVSGMEQEVKTFESNNKKIMGDIQDIDDEITKNRNHKQAHEADIGRKDTKIQELSTQIVASSDKEEKKELRRQQSKIETERDAIYTKIEAIDNKIDELERKKVQLDRSKREVSDRKNLVGTDVSGDLKTEKDHLEQQKQEKKKLAQWEKNFQSLQKELGHVRPDTAEVIRLKKEYKKNTGVAISSPSESSNEKNKRTGKVERADFDYTKAEVDKVESRLSEIEKSMATEIGKIEEEFKNGKIDRNTAHKQVDEIIKKHNIEFETIQKTGLANLSQVDGTTFKKVLDTSNWLKQVQVGNQAMDKFDSKVGKWAGLVVVALVVKQVGTTGFSEETKNDLEDMGIGMIPVVGWVHDLRIAWNGKDMNNRNVEWWDRAGRVVFWVLWLVPVWFVLKMAWKWLVAAGKWAQMTTKIGEWMMRGWESTLRAMEPIRLAGRPIMYTALGITVYRGVSSALESKK